MGIASLNKDYEALLQVDEEEAAIVAAFESRLSPKPERPQLSPQPEPQPEVESKVVVDSTAEHAPSSPKSPVSSPTASPK